MLKDAALEIRVEELNYDRLRPSAQQVTGGKADVRLVLLLVKFWFLFACFNYTWTLWHFHPCISYTVWAAIPTDSVLPGPVSVSVKSYLQEPGQLVGGYPTREKVSVSVSINSCSLGRGGPCELLSPATFNCLQILREQWILLRFLIEFTMQNQVCN